MFYQQKQTNYTTGSNSVSSECGSENNEAYTVQFKKLAPKIPQLHDTKCTRHRKNCIAKHKIQLKPRKQAVNEIPSLAIKDEGLPLLESQLTHVKLFDDSQFYYYSPKPSTSCLTESNHSKHVVHFPTQLPTLTRLNNTVKFTLLPRPSLNRPVEKLLEVKLV